MTATLNDDADLCAVCMRRPATHNDGCCDTCRPWRDDEPTWNERYLTACHEAGHAVAAMMRGGGELMSITIDQDTATQRTGSPALGYTHSRSKPCDVPFITYAGPWDEARAQWTERTLDGEDDDGYIFGDYVSGAFLYNTHGDGDDYRRAKAADPFAEVLAEHRGISVADCWAECEQVWNSELERDWPVIQQVATLLMGGPVAADTIRALLEQCQLAGTLDAGRQP